MAVTDSVTVTVDAPADEVLALLRDIDHQKDWFPGNLASEVLDRDDLGRCTRARMVNDVKVVKDEFLLDYTHADDGFSWRLVRPTLVQRAQHGSWQLAARGGRTEATMTLTVEVSVPLPGFVQRRTVRGTLKGATAALAAQF